MDRDRRLALAEADVRTPMAWQHRDQLYGYQHGGELLYASRAPRGSGSSRPARTASPMDTSNTSSLSSESHIRSSSQVMHPMEQYALPLHLPLPLALPMPPHTHMPPPLMLPPPGAPPPAILLPPMLRPRPLVFPAVPSSPTPPEPLPVREPKCTMLSLPPKDLGTSRGKMQCCRGGCIVFWIILGLIFTGVVLATALRFVVP